MLVLIRVVLLLTAMNLAAAGMVLAVSRQAPGLSLVAFTADRSSIVITLPGERPREWVIAGQYDLLFPQWAPTLPRLAYIEMDPASLLVSDLDQGPPERIGTISLQNLGLSWSPDSTWISFSAPQSASTDIVAANGRTLHNISQHPAYDLMPLWSPDGKKIAFISYRDRLPVSNSELYVVTLASGVTVCMTVRVTNSGATDTLAGWSPDSQWLVYTATWLPDEEPEIWIARADGSENRRITDHPAADTAPVWSPDGQRIAFVSQRGGNSDVYVIRPDGSGLINVSQGAGRDNRPTWSPDGEWIAFESDRDGHLDVYLVRADGSELHNLTDNAGVDFGPVWSPDGRWIAFESLRTGNRDVWAVHPDGSGLTNVSRRGKVDTSPVWSPPVEFPFRPAVVGLMVGGLMIMGRRHAQRR